MPKYSLLLIFMLSVAASPAFAEPAPAAAPVAEVLARERSWLDAAEHCDPAVMDDMLADDFVQTFPDGKRLNKADLMVLVRDGHASGKHRPHLVTHDTVAHPHGDAVVLVGVVDAIDAHGTLLHSALYTDTWVRDGGRWRVVTGHTTHPAAPPR